MLNLEKKKIKFNIIDVVILVVVLAVAAFVGTKIFGKDKEAAAEPKTYEISFYCEEVPAFAAEAVKVGDSVEDETKKVYLGKITDVSMDEAVVFNVDAEGNTVKSSKEGYKSVKITSEVSATEFDHGIVADSIKYSIGHSVTLYAGKGKMVGKVSAINEK